MGGDDGDDGDDGFCRFCSELELDSMSGDWDAAFSLVRLSSISPAEGLMSGSGVRSLDTCDDKNEEACSRGFLSYSPCKGWL